MDIFRFTLKNAKLKNYHAMSWLLVLLNNIAATMFVFLQEPLWRYRYFVAGAILISVLFYYLRKTNTRLIGILFPLFAGIWGLFAIYVAVAANIVFLWLYTFSIRRFEVAVKKDGISYPSFPKREILWNELQNIIMKDGLLTIDFKNNKILQNEIDGEVDVNERDFNEFCRQQLNQ
jgi:hypothetical protein